MDAIDVEGKIDEKIMLIWYYVYNGRYLVHHTNSIWFRIKIVIKSLLFETNNVFLSKYSEKNPETMFFLSQSRSDHISFIEKLYDVCNKDKCLIVANTRRHFNLKRLKYIFDCRGESSKYIRIPFFENGMPVRYKKYKLSLMARVLLKSRIAEWNEMIYRLLESAGDRLNRIVLLCDSAIPENMVIKCAKNRGIEIICCQHGIFSEQPNGDRADNKIDYIFLTCDKYLIWGDYTKELYIKYNRNIRCAICGNLMINKVERGKTHCSDNWLVIFDVDFLHEYNQKMLIEIEKAAKILHKTIDIKIHPREKGKENFYHIDQTVSSFNANGLYYEMAFAHVSSMLYQMLVRGMPVLKFDSDIKTAPIDRTIVFASYKDILALCSKINDIDFEGIGKKHISYIGEEARKYYSNHINS